MAAKKPQKKKSPRKKLSKAPKSFYKSNGKQTTQKSLYDQQLVGRNPVASTLNYGY